MTLGGIGPPALAELPGLCLPVIGPAFLYAFVGTELPNSLATLQKLLVDGPEIVNLPHNFFGSKISAKLAGLI